MRLNYIIRSQVQRMLETVYFINEDNENIGKALYNIQP